MKVLVLIGAILLGVVLLVVVVGWLLPKSHVAARTISLRRKPNEVFQIISDFKAAPSWRSNVREVQLLPREDGHIRYREKSANGSITMEIIESTPPSRMIAVIADRGLPFGGMWIFDVSPTADGCRINITERGEIYNPVFRFVSHFILGLHRTLDTYLSDVSRKFNERATPQDGVPSPP